MAKKSWTIELEDGKHTVDFEAGILGGKRTIRVDGLVNQRLYQVMAAAHKDVACCASVTRFIDSFKLLAK
jgi:hypothetical protein